MKCMKKLVAVLLTAVMAMTLLTACGGGGGGASNGITDKSKAMTNKINEELKNQGSAIQVTYSKEVEDTLKKVYTEYAKNLNGISNPTDEQKDQALDNALKAVKIKAHWAMGTRSFNGTDSDVKRVATSIAKRVKVYAEENNIDYNKIGYVTLMNASGQPYEMWYMVTD